MSAVCRIRNLRRQPVELHGPTVVRVVPPGGEIDIPEVELGAPQIAYLVACRRLRVLTREASGAGSSTAATDKNKKPASSKKRSSTTKTGRSAGTDPQPRSKARKASKPDGDR